MLDAWNEAVSAWQHPSRHRWLGKSLQQLAEEWDELDCPRERSAEAVGVEEASDDDNPSRGSADPQGNHKEVGRHLNRCSSD